MPESTSIEDEESHRAKPLVNNPPIQCSEAASPARFTVDLDWTIKWAASRLLTQAGHRYGGQRSDRTADIWRPMVIHHDIKNKAKAARYLPVYADYMQSDVCQSKAIRYLPVYAGICREM